MRTAGEEKVAFRRKGRQVMRPAKAAELLTHSSRMGPGDNARAAMRVERRGREP